MSRQAGYLRQHSPLTFNVQTNTSKDVGLNGPCYTSLLPVWTKTKEYRRHSSSSNINHSISDGTITRYQDDPQIWNFNGPAAQIADVMKAKCEEVIDSVRNIRDAGSHKVIFLI